MQPFLLLLHSVLCVFKLTTAQFEKLSELVSPPTGLPGHVNRRHALTRTRGIKVAGTRSLGNETCTNLEGVSSSVFEHLAELALY